ncbi:MAG: hypothetical protein ACRC06_17970, partial [Waterburya sp.]
MELDIVLVHGTGVREPAYSKTFSMVQQQLENRSEDLRFHKCYWGGRYGSTLNAGGLSLPKFDENKAIVNDLSDDDYYLGLCELLYQDPLIELQILSIGSEESETVFGEKPGNDLDDKVRALTPSFELQEMLDRANIGEFFSQAKTIIVNESDYQDAITSASEPLGEYRIAIARALVAQSSLLARDKYGDFAFSLNGELRDRIVEQIVAELGGTEKGLVSEVKRSISGTIKRIIENTRRKVSEQYRGTLVDILMYQARGQKLRDFVRATIEPLQGKKIVI